MAFIFNQQFFKDMREQTGVDLENIVYYKDETHYFVMCAKKQSLLDKGVLLKVIQRLFLACARQKNAAHFSVYRFVDVRPLLALGLSSITMLNL